MGDTRITKERRATFLAQLEQGYSVTKAAEQSGLSVRRWYQLRDADPEFAQAWADAYAAGTDCLRDELRRRAVDGVRDFRLDRDGNEHELTVYSDRLLELELKRRDSDYRERQTVELNARGELTVGVQLEPNYQEILETLRAAGVLDQWFRDHPTGEFPALEAGDRELGDGPAPPPDGGES